MKPRILFSVIIPTHNRPELTKRAVESAVAQGSHEREIIVVDDGSTDDTPRVLESLQSQHGIEPMWKNRQGAAVARNTGAQHARGDFLIFLDSDDELLPGALERFACTIDSDGTALVCSSAQTVDPNGNELHLSRPRSLGPAYENQRGLFLAGTFAVRRDVFLKLGGFAAECRSSQHTEFALRMLPYLTPNGLKVAAIDEPTVRVHDHGQAHLRGNLENLLRGAQYIIETHEAQLKKCPKHYSDWCTIAAVYAAKLERFGLARSLLCKAVSANPRKPANYARLLIACLPLFARRVWRPETIK